MGTTPIQDASAFDKLPKQLPSAKVGAVPGKIVLAGSLWPLATAKGGKLNQYDVQAALEQARALSEKGLVMANAAISGDAAAANLMTTWFGPRGTGVRDWWLGTKAILTRINQYMLADINVYYRGADALGKPNDYPGESGLVDKRAVSGYAETAGGAKDGIIGLCRLFFENKGLNERTIQLQGFDSVGGVIVHELSHNLAGTLDHDSAAGGSCYGVTKCRALAVALPSRAWYNADNIEYFCEQALYGDVPAKPPIVTGATGSVKDLTKKFP